MFMVPCVTISLSSFVSVTILRLVIRSPGVVLLSNYKLLITYNSRSRQATNKYTKSRLSKGGRLFGILKWYATQMTRYSEEIQPDDLLQCEYV